jgi:solute carrier family 35 (UDP-galactose transporter), member B1
MQSEHKLTTHELMFFINLSALVLSFFLAIITGEGSSGLIFTQENPEVVPFMQIAAVTSTLGQGFVFFIISNCDSLTLASITTSRKLLTIMLSIYLFEHKISYIQRVGIALVFCGLIFELHGRQSREFGNRYEPRD